MKLSTYLLALGVALALIRPAPAAPAPTGGASLAVYQLPPETLDKLVPATPTAAAADLSGTSVPKAELTPVQPDLSDLDASEVADLKDRLSGLVGREYPSRSLFEAALGAWPYSPELREWIVSQARSAQALGYPGAGPVNWSGREDTYLGRLYPITGFYPLWSDPKAPQTPDFSVLSSVNLFAFTFDTQGSINTPASWSPELTEFLAEADLHRTQVNFTLYRDNWDFLETLGAKGRQALIAQIAGNTKNLLDTPLPDLASRAKAYVPLFGSTKYLADGVTLWLAPPADSSPVLLDGVFGDFLIALTQALADSLRGGGRDYTLNLVICDPRFFETSVFELGRLHTLLSNAQKDLPADADGNSAPSNLTLRFIVPLPDPVAGSAETLRNQIVDQSYKFGGPSQIPNFLQNIVPLIFLAQGTAGPASADADAAAAKQVRDQLGLLDSFYNLALWPAPLQSGTLPSNLDDILWEKFIMPGAARPGAFTLWVAAYRWYIRAVFDLLLLILLACLPYLWFHRLRELPRSAQLALFGGLMLLVLVGALLLEGDPSLEGLRQGNLLLLWLIGLLAVGALYAILKPRVEKP